MKSKVETDRIIKLKREDYHALRFGQLTDELKTDSGNVELRPIQEAALHAIRECRGGFFPIGVGHGKSFIACLAGTVASAKFALVLAPASTVPQLQEQFDDLKKHFHITGKTKIMSYAKLSRPDGERFLSNLVAKRNDGFWASEEGEKESYDAKDIIIVCDEAHKLKSFTSARTKRVMRFIQENQDVMFVALSGTMTSKSINDYAHLAACALREKSPVPRDVHHLAAWSECVDVGGQPWDAHFKAMWPLVEWAGEAGSWQEGENMRWTEKVQKCREALQKRMRMCQGVVASKAGSLGCSLLLKTIKDVELPPSVEHAMERVGAGITPDGDELGSDLDIWRTKRYVSLGFYYVWDWPQGVVDEEWLAARQEWNRQVRSELKHRSGPGYDSPLLVSRQIDAEVRSGRGHRAIHRAWLEWLPEKDKPQPPTKPVWVSDFIFDFVKTWIAKQHPAIVWFETQAVGEKLSEFLPTFGAGDEPPKKAITCAMSIRAFGTGRNLQAWHKQIILEPPSGGQAFEQLLGRCHRVGQQSDTVFCDILLHTTALREALSKAFGDAQYIEQSSGNKQKLLFADFINAEVVKKRI